MKKDKGSALIIAMLLISTVAGVAFGIARLLFVETITAARYENGSVAYFSAESGLEEAFLRYKVNQNSEIPAVFSLANPNNVYRTNLTDNAVDPGSENSGIDVSTSLQAPTKQYYDLRMGYIGLFGRPFVGNDTNNDGKLAIANSYNEAGATGDYQILKISQDNSYVIALSGYNFANRLDLGLTYYNGNNEFNTNLLKCKAVSEIKFTVKYASPAETKEYKAMLLPEETCRTVLNSNNYSLSNVGLLFGSGRQTNPANLSEYNVSFTNIQQIIDTLSKGKMPTTSDQVSMSVKPLSYDAGILLTGNGCDSVANNCPDKSSVPGGPYSYITSTGYYGGVTRTLKANIDRQSGTVYDLYDFVLLKGKE